MDQEKATAGVNVTVRLPPELVAAVDRACAASDVTRSQVVRHLLRDWLASEKQPRLKL
jgi:metal-responsive CopG/Arc/MetJ family transcriptional regulator